MVLPDGMLTNASLQGVRDWVLERFKVLAVVSLPPFAFAHFGAGVKSSVVFLEKRSTGEVPSDEEAVFMAVANNIGYDAAGRSTYEVETIDETAGESRVELQRCDLFDWQVCVRLGAGEGSSRGGGLNGTGMCRRGAVCWGDTARSRRLRLTSWSDRRW